MININRLEATYNNVLNRLFSIANPIKKSVKKTECKVHIFLNNQAVESLLDYKYIMEYNFFNYYIWSLNEGTVWADQDFKSSSHFYNPYKKRGLYGRKSAMDLAKEYYQKALNLWRSGDKKNSIFYLGATIHIIQDMTVPQHANIKLLDDHHQYEAFVKKIYMDLIEYTINQNPYLMDSIADYVRFNSRISLKVYRRFKHIKEDDCRYFRTIRCTLPLAKRTTAGALILFFNNVNGYTEKRLN